jgi:hypothetical protein
MKTSEQLQQYILSHPNLTNGEISKNLGLYQWGQGVSAVEAARKALKNSPKISSLVPDKPKLTIGQPVAMLIEKYDFVAKIKQVMATLDKESYLPDSEMRHKCGANSAQWNAIIENEKIKKYRYALPKGQFAWMHIETQNKLTKLINLAEVS